MRCNQLRGAGTRCFADQCLRLIKCPLRLHISPLRLLNPSQRQPTINDHIKIIAALGQFDPCLE